MCSPTFAALVWEDALEQLPAKMRQTIDVFDDIEEHLRNRFIRKAQEAWRLIHLYDISMEKKDYSEYDLPSFFHEWALSYQQLCTERKIMDEWHAMREYNRLVYEGSLTPPSSLWVGWTDMPPLYAKTWELLKQGSNKETQKTLPLAEKVPDAQHSCLSYEDEKQELEALARRVALYTQENPQSQVGVVIPALEKSWYEVRHIFRSAFGLSALGEKGQAPFDMSWGETIDSHPLIADLLDILSLSPKAQDIDRILDLFRTPYIRGATAERAARFALRTKLIELSRRQHSIYMLTELKRSARNIFSSCPQLHRALKDFFNVDDAFLTKASPSHWADIFNKQTQSLGWGAVEKWSDQEMYLRGRWQTILDDLYAMQRSVPSCTRERALSFLRAQAQKIFQPQQGQTKVRILGIWEAEELVFDKLFVCQMYENTVPPPDC